MNDQKDSILFEFRAATLVGLILTIGSLLAGSSALAGDEVRFESIKVDDPRPLAAAIWQLGRRHGLVITYEDPRYAHETDVVDVTLKVRKDLEKYEKGKAPRVLIPRGGSLELSYPVSVATGLPGDPATVLRELIAAHVAAGYPGTFRLEQEGETFHVIPITVKDHRGVSTPQESLLDIPVILDRAQRNGFEVLRAITLQLEVVSDTPVLIGMVPLKPFARFNAETEATGEIAREVLSRLFAGLDHKASWRLFYDPGMELYALNAHLVIPRVPELRGN